MVLDTCDTNLNNSFRLVNVMDFVIGLTNYGKKYEVNLFFQTVGGDNLV